MADRNDELLEETVGAEAAPEELPAEETGAEVAVTDEEEIPGETSLGTLTVSPANIPGIEGKSAGDDIELKLLANISEVDEDGNVTLTLGSGELVEADVEAVAAGPRGAAITEGIVAP